MQQPVRFTFIYKIYWSFESIFMLFFFFLSFIDHTQISETVSIWERVNDESRRFFLSPAPARLPFNINILFYWSTTNKFSFKIHSFKVKEDQIL